MLLQPPHLPLVSDAVACQDEKLTLEEMLQNPNVFYSLVDKQLNGGGYDYYDNDYYHDEF
jgi:hypothetical protein